MIPRKRIPLCAVCQEWTRYRAAEEGIAEIQGVRVKISKGDPLCLSHGVVNLRIQPLLYEEFVVA